MYIVVFAMFSGHNARLTYTLPREEDRKYFLMTSVEATNTGVLKVHRVRKLGYDQISSGMELISYFYTFAV